MQIAAAHGSESEKMKIQNSRPQTSTIPTHGFFASLSSSCAFSSKDEETEAGFPRESAKENIDIVAQVGRSLD